MTDLPSDDSADLDELMYSIRMEIDRSRSESPEKYDSRSLQPGVVQAATVSLQAPSDSSRRTLAQRFDIRVLFQRLLGIRRLVKLGRKLEKMQLGPLPIESLPYAVIQLQNENAVAGRSLEITAKRLSQVEEKLRRMDMSWRSAENLGAPVARVADAINEVHIAIERYWSQAVDQSLVREPHTLKTESWGRRIELQTNASDDIDRDERKSCSEIAKSIIVGFEEFQRSQSDNSNLYIGGCLSALDKAVRETGIRVLVDVQCGRGKCIELLRSYGYQSTGVDSNPVMVDHCRELGLDVVEGNAVDHLRKLHAGSVAGITGFQVTDHFSFDALIELVDAALATLAPGGVLILEAPNPANLVVAVERFYLNPIRRKPLPSAMMAFTLRSRGFVDVSELHLQPVEHLLRRDSDPMLSLLQENLYGPRDYGLVAWKPNS